MYLSYIELTNLLVLLIPLFFILESVLRIPLYTVFKTLMKRREKEEEQHDTPPISVVVISNGDIEQLERLIPAILQQDYPHFELVIVEEGGREVTKQLVNRWHEQYKNIRLTFMPKNSRNIIRSKFSITLGVMAAKYDWILLTEADCMPVSDRWIRTFASRTTPSVDLIIGYSTYKQSDAVSGYWSFDKVRFMLQCFFAVRFCRPLAADRTNIAFRKSSFTAANGFKGYLHLQGGEGTLLVNQISNRNNTTVVCNAEAAVEQELTSPKAVATAKYNRLEALRHLPFGKKYFYYRNGLMGILHFLFLATVGIYAALRTTEVVQAGIYYNESLQFDVMALCTLLMHIALHTYYYNQHLKMLDKQRKPVWTVYLYELIAPFYALYYKYIKAKA